MVERIRYLTYYKNHFDVFYQKQTDKVKEKIDLGLYYLQFTKRTPNRYIGSTGEKNLFYLRIKQSSNIILDLFLL